MNKYIKLFLVLLVACIGSFFIYDNVHATDSNRLDVLTNINNDFSSHPYQLFTDYKVAYCNDEGTTWCNDNYHTGSNSSINVDFVDFYKKLINDFGLNKTFYIITNTNLDSSNPSEDYYLFFSKDPMYLKEELYEESRPQPYYKGTRYRFLYKGASPENYYVMRKIGNKLLSFNAISKDSYNVKFDIKYSVSTDELSSEAFLIFSNYEITDVEDNVIFGSSSYEFDIEAPQKSIFDVIKGVFSTLIELPLKLINSLIDALKSLFIPSDGFFEDWFQTLTSDFEQQLGFLSYPFTFILDILDRFISLSTSTNYIISWPDIKVPNFDVFIIKSGSYNLSSLLEDPTIKTLHDFIYLFGNAFLLISFINLCDKTYKKSFGGDQ